jgi:UDP-galactopyranose mutase
MKNNSFRASESPKYDMIVFCHLRWDFVYQRPQHIISRLAKDYKILVVEEPLKKNQEKAVFSVKKLNSQIHICQPSVDHIDEIGPYLKKHLKQTDFALGWFYSAAFVPVLETLDFESVVYDCMDELSLFKGASSKLLEQEQQLLAAADVVYTGGKSLYESKKQKHHNVFCFPSSVDIDHFSSRNNPKPSDLEGIPSPIIGYYGVIDERIDLDLLKETAAQSPDASFVMIGPLCKIEEQDLPRAENIYYLGMKSYDELPSYLQYFDVAMMPFALNDSTKFISPTKTLEYMAAEKPIISTRIKDVERDYSNCVMLMDDAEDFINAIKNPKQNFRREYREILEKTSWDSTAENMRLMIKKAIA